MLRALQDGVSVAPRIRERLTVCFAPWPIPVLTVQKFSATQQHSARYSLRPQHATLRVTCEYLLSALSTAKEACDSVSDVLSSIYLSVHLSTTDSFAGSDAGGPTLTRGIRPDK